MKNDTNYIKERIITVSFDCINRQDYSVTQTELYAIATYAVYFVCFKQFHQKND